MARSRSLAPAAISIAAVAKHATIAVPRSGSTTTSAQASADDAEVRHQLAEAADDRRPVGEQLGAVEHQRELHHLGGLDLERAGADPALRAVDLDPDARQQDREAEHERDREQERRQRRAARLTPCDREQAHDQQPDAPKTRVRFR